MRARCKFYFQGVCLEIFNGRVQLSPGIGLWVCSVLVAESSFVRVLIDCVVIVDWDLNARWFDSDLVLWLWIIDL